MDVKPAVELSCELPHRFLIHFGTLGPIKGTDVVAAALPIVWREEPSFTLVIAGAARRWTTRGQEFCPDLLTEYSRMWGRLSDRVIWLGEIEKSQLYAVLQRAEAAVLPSRYDNLPNTAIESLSLGVPVIGTRGASIDELVEPGYNGDLVPVGDHHSLAELLLKAWRGQATWIGNGFRQPSIFSQMDPKVAASGLIQLAGFHT